ncbi:uncharacterized protein [Argopecten irradians]|uniref:uncharacterized protein n=1 Tax=Argopecten irradians TaxID=31199 RepID=UPI00371E0D3F
METQKDFYMDDFMQLTTEEKLRRDSPIISLSPYIDSNGVMRVGGRLNRLKDILNQNELNPIIIPGKSHVGMLIVRYYHAATEHQGRHLTEGAVRAAGFWIVGCRRLVNSIIHHCVKFRKLRGQLLYQKMSDLPLARVTPSAPFTFVGLDVFGPWQVTSRKTRGGLAHSKRWAVIFTCLASRAIHIEVVEDMTSSAFINALRRFVSIRGEVQELYSDRGTNFVGSTNDLKIDTINVGDGPVKDYLYRRGITWKFNSPHSSHMGGVWERMIGLSRRILDSLLLEHNNKNLTHEVLTTLMYEVCAILNARPIISVSNDSETPQILSPSVLLTQKTGRVEEPLQELGIRDMYKAQWKHVQVLANSFWSRWQKEYLQSLQGRKKWQSERQNVKTGDIVLLKDKNTPRNDWSVSRVVDTFSGEDNLVRKVKVKVTRDGTTSFYIRPVTDLVLILSE